MANDSSSTFDFSLSSVSGIAAPVLTGESSGAQTQESASSESSVVTSGVESATPGKRKSRSRSPSKRLPPTMEDAVISYAGAEEQLVQVMPEEVRRTGASSSEGRRSSRDAAGTPRRRAVSLLHPTLEPLAMGTWMGVRASGAPDTPRDRRGQPMPPREPKARGVSPLPPIPLADLHAPQERGDMVAIDIDFDAELAEVVELDQQLVALDPEETKFPPQPTPEMQGVIVAAAPMPPTPNGAGVLGGMSNPTNKGVAGMATSSSTDVVQHFDIGTDDVRVKRAPRVRPRRV